MITFSGGPDSTLQSVKDWIGGRLYDGVICPACAQQVKLRLRSVTPELAYGLILIYQQFAGPPPHVPNHVKEGWLHVLQFFHAARPDPPIPTTLSGGGDFVKLRFFGLIEPKPGKKRAGYYRITKFGRSWVRGKATIQDCFYMYNGEFVDAGPGEAASVTIKQVLTASSYNYKTLMQGYI